MQMNKAQSSFEMLVMVGTLLLFSIPVILFFFSSSSFSIQKANIMAADALSQRLADAINQVAIDGQGAQLLDTLYVPAGVTNITCGKGYVRVIYDSRGQRFVFFRKIIAQRTVCSFPESGKHLYQGLHTFNMTYVDPSAVKVVIVHG